MITISKEDYINKALQRPYIIDSLESITEKIKNKEKVIFTKFGDGEYIAMRLNDINDHNCDGDRYTHQLGVETSKAICELADRSSDEYIYIGKWRDYSHSEIIEYYHSLYYDYLINNNKEEKYIPFINYTLVYPDNHFDTNNSNIFDFVDTIQKSSYNKVIISNERNMKLQTVFKSDTFISIPEQSWYANGLYDNIKNSIEEILKIKPDSLLLIAAGLASKILINEISKEYPNVSIIDLGSGYDILARKYPTRLWGHGLEGFPNCYKNQLEYFKPLLPPNYDEL